MLAHDVLSKAYTLSLLISDFLGVCGFEPEPEWVVTSEF